MAHRRKLEIEGDLSVIETTGTWGIYAGERILIGSGQSFRDDLGVKIREMFQTGAREALASGQSPGETFSLPKVRITIELLEPPAPPSTEAA
jgi:hypothetical protein